MKAIGVIEITSVAKGIEICDRMIKASNVKVLEALPLCPGKYVIIIGGKVADVKNSVDVAVEEAGAFLVDRLLIPNIDDQVFKALNNTNSIDNVEALGIIETFSVSSGIMAADTAVKAANVHLIEVRLSRGLGGKAFVTMTGTVGDVKAAVSAGSEQAKSDGLLVGFAVIPSPHEDLKKFIV
ncbi:MAG: BMC domain-containing protein [Clostridiales bacterium]|nr:BMC domain-containing protein [Clostridiales bacterium]